MPPLPTADLDHVLPHTADVWPSLSGQRLFITGGTGFVGKWLLESLLWANDRLGLNLAVTALTRDPDRFRSSAPHLANHPSMTLLGGNASSFEFPAGSFPFVIHAATEAPPCFDADVAATRHVLDFATRAGTRRLLFTSSGAVYGKQPPELTHIPEDYVGAPSTTDPGTAYGQAKRVSEFLCTTYARQYGFDALIARLFAFVGPHLPLDSNFAVGNFIRDALDGSLIRVKGDGTPFRSYLYAADLAIWLWTILFRGQSARPYNVGSGQDLTIAEIARTVVEATNPDLRIEVAEKAIPGRPALRYVPLVVRASEELGLRALIPLGPGIARTYRWHQGSNGERWWPGLLAEREIDDSCSTVL